MPMISWNKMDWTLKRWWLDAQPPCPAVGPIYPVAVITQKSTDEIRVIATELGISGYLSVPFSTLNFRETDVSACCILNVLKPDEGRIYHMLRREGKLVPTDETWFLHVRDERTIQIVETLRYSCHVWRPDDDLWFVGWLSPNISITSNLTLTVNQLFFCSRWSKVVSTVLFSARSLLVIYHS